MNRYLCYQARKVGDEWKVTLLYLEGAATLGAADTKSEKIPVPIPRDKSYEEMTVEELQSVILEKLAKNGPVTDQMRRDVEENIWHDSLVNWARSF